MKGFDELLASHPQVERLLAMPRRQAQAVQRRLSEAR